MNRRQELNALIKECITSALIRMLDKQTLEEISITDLVQEAGVSRVSFYRNFESKQDVLQKYMEKLLQEWGAEYESRNDPAYFGESLTRHYYKYKDFYLLLYKRGLSWMIYESIRWATRMEESQTNLERYTKSMLTGMLFGMLDEWMRLGMPETPDELMALVGQNGNSI